MGQMPGEECIMEGSEWGEKWNIFITFTNKDKIFKNGPNANCNRHCCLEQ